MRTIRLHFGVALGMKTAFGVFFFCKQRPCRSVQRVSKNNSKTGTFYFHVHFQCVCSPFIQGVSLERVDTVDVRDEEERLIARRVRRHLDQNLIEEQRLFTK